MKVWIHCLVSVVLVAFFFPIYQWFSLLIILGMVFIDFDHYLYYVIKYKDYSLGNSIMYYKKITRKKDVRSYHKVLRLFHTVEILLPIIILSFFIDFIMIISIGILIHVAMDVVAEKRTFGKLTHMYLLSNYNDIK